jgi:hypothetical protein
MNLPTPGPKGSVLSIGIGGILQWVTINGAFDQWWSNKYSIRCDRFIDKRPTYRHDENPSTGYGRVYKLYEFLWKMKIVKLP